MKCYFYDADGYLCGLTSNETDARETALRKNLLWATGDPPATMEYRPETLTTGELRRRGYKDNASFQEDYLDGIVKLASPDPLVVAEGQAQIAKYQQDCLAVKARYPKS